MDKAEISNATMDEFISLISDPTTGKIFHTPIITEKGIVCEKDEFVENNFTKYYVVVALKSLITSFLDTYPEHKKKQYAPTNNIFKLTHVANKMKISESIDTGDYVELKKYTKFSILLFGEVYVKIILRFAPNDVIFHIIDNCHDIHEQFDGSSWSLINYACNMGNGLNKPEIIKHIINKGGNMAHHCGDGWYPLHQILRFSGNNDEFRKYGIDKHIEAGLNMFVTTNDGETVLEFVFHFANTIELIHYALSKIDINSDQFKTNVGRLIDRIDANERIKEKDKETMVSMLLSKIE